jgi:hypothetical protein
VAPAENRPLRYFVDTKVRRAPATFANRLPQGTAVCESGSEVEHVYFPHNGMFSLLNIMRNGKAIETATVGREGVVGAMAGLGLYKSLVL